MPSGVIRLRMSRDAVMELFGSRKFSVSRDIDKILDKYSEKVEEDVLVEFLKERR